MTCSLTWKDVALTVASIAGLLYLAFRALWFYAWLQGITC